MHRMKHVKGGRAGVKVVPHQIGKGGLLGSTKHMPRKDFVSHRGGYHGGRASKKR